jgi:hypothetical protein
MSKKLIAVASATALALSALVGVAPAMASAPSIALAGGTGSGTSAAPQVISVPYNNTLDHAGTPETAVEFVIGSSPALAIGDVITVTATGDVKLVEAEVDTANANFDVTTLGKTSLTYTKTNTTAVTFFAYTTKVTTGTVKVDITRTGLSTSNTYYIKGAAGLKHTVSDVAGVPATLLNTKTATISFTVKDVFGNLIENDAATISASNTRVNMGAPTWNATTKKYESVLTSPSSSAFVASLDLGGADIDGMADAADAISAVVNNPAVATANAAATAQIAALTAQLAASRPIATSVTKKKYNTLARKWNAAFPSQKVALKK